MTRLVTTLIVKVTCVRPVRETTSFVESLESFKCVLRASIEPQEWFESAGSVILHVQRVKPTYRNLTPIPKTGPSSSQPLTKSTVQQP